MLHVLEDSDILEEHTVLSPNAMSCMRCRVSARMS
jgi:hypothetical protein